MYHALIGPEGIVDRVGSDINPNVPTKEGWYWLPVVETPTPEYDPVTQWLGEMHYVVENTKVTKYWDVHTKSAIQIEKEKLLRVNQIDPIIMIALHDMFNRFSTPLNNITLEEYKNILKDLI